MRCGPAAPRARHCFWPGPAVGWTAWLEPGGAGRVGTAPSTRVFACNACFYLGRALFKPDLRVLRVAWLEPGGAERVGTAPSTRDVACKRCRKAVATLSQGPASLVARLCRLQVAWLELGGAGRVGTAPRTRSLRATTIFRARHSFVIPTLQSCRSRGWSRGCAGREGTAHIVWFCFVAFCGLWLRGRGVVVVGGGWGRGSEEAVGVRGRGEAVGTGAWGSGWGRGCWARGGFKTF